MAKILMSDIKIRDNKGTARPVNSEGCEFFKYAAVSGASLLSLFLVNKLTNFKTIALSENNVDSVPKNRTNQKSSSISSLAFTETSKEMVFYDKRGDELLIFEK